MKPYLVIDVGNTSSKFASVSSGRISRITEVPTIDLKNQRGTRLLSGFRRLGLREAMVCSVVPSAMKGLRACLKKIGVTNIQVVSSKMNLGIGIRYPKPQTIGADRLVNSVAAVALYGAPAIVVDFGTAVTFDVVSTNQEYLGGVIAPGLRSMTNYLYEQTALLPAISLQEPRSPVGKNTVEAMRVGAVIGYRGLIREILHSIAKQMNWKLGAKTKGSKKVRVIATGGHSRLIAGKVSEISEIDPELTLKGLRILFERMKRDLGN